MEEEYLYEIVDDHANLGKVYTSLNPKFGDNMEQRLEVTFGAILTSHPNTLPYFKTLYSMRSKKMFMDKYHMTQTPTGSKPFELKSFIFDGLGYDRKNAHSFAVDLHKLVLTNR